MRQNTSRRSADRASATRLTARALRATPVPPRRARAAPAAATIAFAALALAASDGASAQNVRPPCTPTASLGIAGWGVDNGSVTTLSDGSVRYEFRTEPAVLRVREGGPADGRLRRGDVLVRIDGDLITTPSGWRRLERLRPGDRVVLTVRRDGRLAHETIDVGEECRRARTAAPAPPAGVRSPRMPPLPSIPAAPSLPAPPAPPVVADQGAYLGLSFTCEVCVGRLARDDGDPAGGTIRWEFRDPPRLNAVMRGGPAWAAGLRSGDRLVEVNGHRITTPAGWEAFSSLEPGTAARMTVERAGERRTLTIVPEEAPSRYIIAETPGAPAAPAPSYAAADADSPLRYSEVLGDAAIEVRGNPVNTYYDRESGELIIRAPGTWIRIRLTDKGGR